MFCLHRRTNSGMRMHTGIRKSNKGSIPTQMRPMMSENALSTTHPLKSIPKSDVVTITPLSSRDLMKLAVSDPQAPTLAMMEKRRPSPTNNIRLPYPPNPPPVETNDRTPKMHQSCFPHQQMVILHHQDQPGGSGRFHEFYQLSQTQAKVQQTVLGASLAVSGGVFRLICRPPFPP